MRVLFTPEAWSDYVIWQTTVPVVLRRINALIANVGHTPFVGMGKPEPLKRPLSGWWSRRITQEHRLVYRVEDRADAQTLVIAACRFHYGQG